MKTKKIRLASILLGLVMALCLMPGLAIAEGPAGVADGGRVVAFLVHFHVSEFSRVALTV